MSYIFECYVTDTFEFKVSLMKAHGKPEMQKLVEVEI